jgi:hypothetical protein
MTAMVNDSALPDADATPRPSTRPVTIRQAPTREPPYDDERGDERDDHRHHSGPMQPALPFEIWPHRLSRPRSWSAVRPTGRGALPDPVLWSRRLVVALLEVRAGRRPLAQLAPHLSPSVLAGLAEARLRGRWSTPQPGTLRTLRGCEPVDGVAEIAAVVELEDGGRCQALAARLESLDNRWRCVRLQFG